MSGQLCSKGYSAHVSPLPAVPSPLPEATLLPVSFVSPRDFLYASTACGMQPLLLKQMRKDPKHYFAPCFLHLMKLGDHNISVQIVLHSCEQPHSNPLSPCLPPPPSLITTLLWWPRCAALLPTSKRFHRTPVSTSSGSCLPAAQSSWPNNLAAR